MSIFVAMLLTLAPCTATAAAEQPTDDFITTSVRSVLEDDPRVGVAAIEIRADGGIVSLTGSVNDLAAKNYAVREAKKIAGVKGVVDRLDVVPDDRPDSLILADVAARLANSEVLKDLGIRVQVDGGAVTLAGTVDSVPQDKQAELLAGEVRGVRAVINHLVVDPETRRTDEEVQSDVTSAIANDVYLTGLPIAVVVRDGVVVLRGNVGSGLERERAIRDAALVAGVRNVTGDIDIRPWIDPGTRRQLSIPSDDELARQVRLDLGQDPRVDASRIRIEAGAGQVVLRGWVPTWYQRETGERDARDVVGVVRVDNRLEVDVAARDDDSIRDDIVARLKSDYALANREISVTVSGGAVSLSGAVGSFYEKRHVADALVEVRGVRALDNRLDVTAPPEADVTLKRRIEARLAADSITRRVADRIHVAVEGRHATLRGEVDRWDEYREAERLASGARGVSDVANDLTIRAVSPS